MSALTTSTKIQLAAGSPPAPVASATPNQILALKIACAGVAGVIGATAMYPIDLCKTRLQNQVKVPGQPPTYSGLLDCLLKTRQAEGFKGLYSGLRVNLIGIIPEKAIKIGVNDILRDKFADAHGVVSMPKGALAGAMAGLCQLIATNPMEICKIRMQLAKAAGQETSLGQVVKELGIKGLYKGSPATLLRDIPFSVVFFCLYGQLKDTWATNANGEANFFKILASGMTAGVVAAAMATPADFIKTNLQKKGATQSTIMGQIRHTLAHGGPSAFFAGVGPRCLTIGPLFAITLMSYEVQKYLMVELGWAPRPQAKA